MSRRRIAVAVLVLIVLVLAVYWTCRSNAKRHPAVRVVEAWGQSSEWSLVSHTEPRHRTVRGMAGWIFRARFVDLNGNEWELWFLVQNGAVLCATLDATYAPVRETIAQFAEAYGN